MGLDNEKQIYIFKNKLYPIYKIGMSKTPKSRLKSIQTNSGFPLESIFESDLIKNGKEAEALIHQALKQYRTHGEWFEIDEQLAIETAERITEEAEKADYKNPVEDYQLDRDCTYLLEYHIGQSEVLSKEGLVNRFHKHEEFIYRDSDYNYYILFNQLKLKRTAVFCTLFLARKFRKQFYNRLIDIE